MRQASLLHSGIAGSAPGAREQSYILRFMAEPHRIIGNTLVTGRFIHTAPQEQMDAPDASGAESLVPQTVIETGDGVF